MFDGYLRERAQQTGQPFVPFGAADYEEYAGSGSWPGWTAWGRRRR